MYGTGATLTQRNITFDGLHGRFSFNIYQSPGNKQGADLFEQSGNQAKTKGGVKKNQIKPGLIKSGQGLPGVGGVNAHHFGA